MKWLTKLTKWFVRSCVIQDKNRRGHKRKIFFESIFQELKNGIGSFTGIKGDDMSFSNACHDMAASYDFYPFDRTYNLDVGKFFNRFHSQTYESLLVTIERKSSILRMILLRSGIYKITANVDESGWKFDFSYEEEYPSKKSNSLAN